MPERKRPSVGFSALAVDQTVVVFGGRAADGTVLNDVWEVSTTDGVFSAVRTEGTPPAPREYHTTHCLLQKMLIIQGHIENTSKARSLNHTIPTYHTKTHSWGAITTHATPPDLRCHHTSVLYEAVLYLLGGVGYEGEHSGAILDGFWSIDVSQKDPVWREVGVSGMPSPSRWGHAACVWGGQMVVFGGVDECGHEVSSFHFFDFSSQTWKIKQSQKHSALADFAADGSGIKLSFVKGDIITVTPDATPTQGWTKGTFGGKSGWLPSSHIASYAPSARSLHTMTSLNGGVLLWGGESGAMSPPELLNDTWMYTVEEEWVRCATKGALPQGRSGACIVEVGGQVFLPALQAKEMFVLSGSRWGRQLLQDDTATTNRAALLQSNDMVSLIAEMAGVVQSSSSSSSSSCSSLPNTPPPPPPFPGAVSVKRPEVPEWNSPARSARESSVLDIDPPMPTPFLSSTSRSVGMSYGGGGGGGGGGGEQSLPTRRALPPTNQCPTSPAGSVSPPRARQDGVCAHSSQFNVVLPSGRGGGVVPTDHRGRDVLPYAVNARLGRSPQGGGARVVGPVGGVGPVYTAASPTFSQPTPRRTHMSPPPPERVAQRTRVEASVAEEGLQVPSFRAPPIATPMR